MEDVYLGFDCRGMAKVHKSYLDEMETYDLFEQLKEEPWEYQPINIYGRECMQNRQTLNWGQTGLKYRYSGKEFEGSSIPSYLDSLISKLNIDLNASFNFILGNYYKDGTETIGMHSDDIRDLKEPIACISLGAKRTFHIQNKNNGLRTSVELEDGDMLVMYEGFQHIFKHGINREVKAGPRISLTFRQVKKD